MDVVHIFPDLMQALHGLRKMARKFGPDIRSRLGELYIIKAMEIEDGYGSHVEMMPVYS